jgi:predicted RNA binding protein YcfA (HicA-like mRNA interferase family)
MSKADKLKEKLKNGSIDARELRKLLKQEGAKIRHTVGSHETWVLSDRRMTLATHKNDLLPYQIKNAREFLCLDKK